jgi:hypothetical protein
MRQWDSGAAGRQRSNTVEQRNSGATAHKSSDKVKQKGNEAVGQQDRVQWGSRDLRQRDN